MTYQLLAVLFSGLLVACQNSSSGGGSSAPNDKAKQSEEGDKNGSSDDGDEIAIVRLVDDLGECNKSRRGKSYYVLADKKFRYCGDSDQWDVVDLKGSAGASGEAGKTSLVAVTSESAGGNCAAGGQKIQSGLDANGNGTLDASEVTSTSFACNGLAGAAGAAGATGVAGAAGSNGKPSLVAVTAEAAGSNCASGGHKVRSGLDSNSSGVLDDSEVQSTSFVCHGAQGAAGAIGATGAAGAAGAAGANGKNSLIKVTAEAAGTNCPFGGKKIEVGSDASGNGLLDAGEVSQTTYVCDGSSLKLKKSDGTVVGQIISILIWPRLDIGTQRQTATMIFLVKSSTNNAFTAYIGARSSLMASSWSGITYLPSLDSTATPGALKLMDISFWGQTANYANYDQLHYASTDCSGQAYVVRTFGNSYQPDGDVLLFGTLPSFSVRYTTSILLVMNQSAETWTNRALGSFGLPGSCQTVSTNQISSPVQVVSSSSSEWPLSISAGWTISP